MNPIPADTAVKLLAALVAFRDVGISGGQDFAEWHPAYLPAIKLAREAIAEAECFRDNLHEYQCGCRHDAGKETPRYMAHNCVNCFRPSTTTTEET